MRADLGRNGSRRAKRIPLRIGAKLFGNLRSSWSLLLVTHSRGELLRFRKEARMNRFRSYDGTTIAFHDEGSGPAVMLLHGYGLDGSVTLAILNIHARSLRER